MTPFYSRAQGLTRRVAPVLSPFRMRSLRTFCSFFADFLIGSAALLIISLISSLVIMHFQSPSVQERAVHVYQKQRRAYKVDTANRDVGSDPSEGDESELEEAPRQKEHRRRPGTRQQANATPGILVLPFRYIDSILGWTFGLISTTLNFLQGPLTLILAVLLFSYGVEYSTNAITGSLCGLPVASSYITECKPGPPPQPRLPTLFDSLDYSSKLEELQKFGSDNQEMVYALTIGEGEIRKMIFQMSITDAPSK